MVSKVQDSASIQSQLKSTGLVKPDILCHVNDLYVNYDLICAGEIVMECLLSKGLSLTLSTTDLISETTASNATGSLKISCQSVSCLIKARFKCLNLMQDSQRFADEMRHPSTCREISLLISRTATKQAVWRTLCHLQIYREKALVFRWQRNAFTKSETSGHTLLQNQVIARVVK